MKTPLKVGSSGLEVLELKQKLIKAGFLLADSVAKDNSFDESVQQAVLALQEERGLDVDGICGSHTWAALLEAEWQLGDRLLYLTSPMLRGDDVGSLQKFLGQLGFNAGREDGIFGPDTEKALAEFQLNNGLSVDKICGPDTLQGLQQISQRARGQNVASLKDREKLQTMKNSIATSGRISVRKIFLAHILSDPASAASEPVGDTGEPTDDANEPASTANEKEAFDLFASTAAKELAEAQNHWGFSDFDISTGQDYNSANLAAQANEMPADICMGFKFLNDAAFQTSYYSTGTYESAGGKHLAELLTAKATQIFQDTAAVQAAKPKGMRLPLLRETKMWSVVCVLGPNNEIELLIKRLARVLPEIIGVWLNSSKS